MVNLKITVTMLGGVPNVAYNLKTNLKKRKNGNKIPEATP